MEQNVMKSSVKLRTKKQQQDDAVLKIAPIDHRLTKNINLICNEPVRNQNVIVIRCEKNQISVMENRSKDAWERAKHDNHSSSSSSKTKTKRTTSSSIKNEINQNNNHSYEDNGNNNVNKYEFTSPFLQHQTIKTNQIKRMLDTKQEFSENERFQSQLHQFNRMMKKYEHNILLENRMKMIIGPDDMKRMTNF